MTSHDGTPSTARPVILGAVSTPQAATLPRGGGGGRVRFASLDARRQRLNARFEAAAAAFQTQIQLARSLPAADPQLVLVLEARDERIDLTTVAKKLDIELLVETETSVAADDEFEMIKPRATPLISASLHAVCVNQAAMNELLGLWRAWKDDQELGHGYAKMRDLFMHLKDVRPWGPQDRIKMIDWDEHFAGELPGTTRSIDIELWFRGSPAARAAAETQVRDLVTQAGGQAHHSAIFEAIGYHGLKCELPIEVIERLARGEFDAIQLVKSANVMYLRVTGQVIFDSGPGTDQDVIVSAPPPTGFPVVCLFDGLPATNHPLLQNRVDVYDPDDLASGYDADERRHGTWMTSAVVWGDRSESDNVASPRPVMVRPVLVPSPETQQRLEELPIDVLVPDLMWRAFRDLFEPGPAGTAPAAPEIAIINLSIGDPTMPFDTIVSSWARMIDWLSYQYGVLVIVSAGNHPKLNLSPLDSDAFVALRGDDRRRALLDALDRHQNERRLLAPSESINAITVGALHADSSDLGPVGYQVDPADGLVSVSPVTSVGSGYRRSIKPDVAAPGGRVMFVPNMTNGNVIAFGGTSVRGPGVKVAATANGRETYTVGTSVATALVTRRASALHDLVELVTQGVEITRRQRVAAIKALLVHGTDPLDDVTRSESNLRLERVVGNGIVVRNFAQGCAANEAVLLFLGQLGAGEEQELTIPLPDGLGVRDTKRIDASLAWLSPINWRHRQYRRAALSFSKPGGAIPLLDKPSGLSAEAAKAGATTVQHLTWETRKAFGSGQGSAISVKVKCLEQAGGLDGVTIDYAAVVSLWVAPAIGVDVYAQVRSQVQPRVGIKPV
jgi:Subtilase family